jgi:predicted  nucleic acid-binding Zn-ribbon protein
MSEREQYVEKAKARIDQWNADIEKLQAKAGEAKADAKIEYEKQLRELRAQRDEAKEKLDEIAKASDSAWDDMKAGFESAWDKISSAFDTTKTGDK